MKPKSVIAVDFDGTCVTHAYPLVGCEIGAADVLRALVEQGHKLILFTMRGHGNRKDPRDYLGEAVQWFASKGLPLFGVNRNPGQHHWTTSPKAYAHLYIDDAALGIPLLYMPAISERPFVDWSAVENLLRKDGWLPPLPVSSKPKPRKRK